MGYLKYQLEEEQLSFGDGEWFFTGNKRTSNKVVGRYTSSDDCEGMCNACNKVVATYENGETYTIPYDCNPAHSKLTFEELYEVNDYLPVSSITSLDIGECVTQLERGHYNDGTDVPHVIRPYFSKLSSVTFSNSSSLKHIGESFFRNTKLTTISFPNSLNSMESLAIDDNEYLTEIEFNEGLKDVRLNISTLPNITSITIPSSVIYVEIGHYSYVDTNIRKITMLGETPPKYLSIEGIGNSPIYVPCQSLEKYKKAYSAYTNHFACIGEPWRISFTFEDAEKIYLPFNDGIIRNSDIISYKDDAVSFGFPNENVTISANNFSALTSIQGNITIPNAHIIPNRAFSNLSGVTSLTIGSGCTFTSTAPFSNMPDLEAVTIENGLTLIPKGMLSGCTNLSSCTIGNGVTSIGNNAFYKCSGLTSINIPNSVTSIGDYTFSGCKSLTSATIGNSVISIGYSTFYSCSSLTSITIPDSVTSIGSYAFRDCTSLTSIDIPNSVTYIGASAFRDCTSLISVTIGSGDTVFGNNIFNNCNNLKDVVINSSQVSGILFSGNTSITSVTLGDNVTSIGNYAFQNCSSLTSIVIADSVTSIGVGAFRGCTSLSNIDIPSGVTSIDNYAFENCTSLTSVTVRATTPPTLGYIVFPNSIVAIYVPSESVETYKAASGWRNYASRIQAIPNS